MCVLANVCLLLIVMPGSYWSLTVLSDNYLCTYNHMHSHKHKHAHAHIHMLIVIVHKHTHVHIIILLFMFVGSWPQVHELSFS